MANLNFCIGNLSGDYILIETINLEYPGDLDSDDAAWANVKIKMQVGCWSGQYKGSLRIDELSQFSSNIDDLLSLRKNEVTFSPMEPWIVLTLTATDPENFSIFGTAIDEINDGNKLSFRFKVAKSDLSDTFSNLGKVLYLLQERKM